MSKTPPLGRMGNPWMMCVCRYVFCLWILAAANGLSPT